METKQLQLLCKFKKISRQMMEAYIYRQNCRNDGEAFCIPTCILREASFSIRSAGFPELSEEYINDSADNEIRLPCLFIRGSNVSDDFTKWDISKSKSKRLFDTLIWGKSEEIPENVPLTEFVL